MNCLTNIVIGLQVRLSKSKQTHSFSCAQLPTMKRSSFVNWRELKSEAVKPNTFSISSVRGFLKRNGVIYLHDIKDERKLFEFKELKTDAVILVNSDENYDTAEEMVARLLEQKFHFPFFVVTKGDGKTLLNHEKEHEGSIEARVGLEISVDKLPDGRKIVEIHSQNFEENLLHYYCT